MSGAQKMTAAVVAHGGVPFVLSAERSLEATLPS
jgi:hypothetical protein